jgi:hypothetical protein
MDDQPLLRTYPFRPDVKFFCDLDYDPFLIMQDQNKVYGQPKTSLSTKSFSERVTGFTVSLYEYEATIPSLWTTVKGRLHSLLPQPIAVLIFEYRIHQC